MKTVLAIIMALTLASCAASRRADAPSASQTRADDGHRFEKPPVVGMTRAQALARYGKPRRRVLTEQGERWYYVLNRSEVVGKTLNPLSLTIPKYRVGVLLFGSNAKVKRFAWEPKKER